MEGLPNQIEIKKTSEELIETRRRKKIALAREIVERGEIFPFSGIDPDVYTRRKEDDEELPGLVCPIDELLKKFKEEGMKVVFGVHPESGNVFIVPAQSEDIEWASLFPRQLQIKGEMDDSLKNLISTDLALLEAIKAGQS